MSYLLLALLVPFQAHAWSCQAFYAKLGQLKKAQVKYWQQIVEENPDGSRTVHWGRLAFKDYSPETKGSLSANPLYWVDDANELANRSIQLPVRKVSQALVERGMLSHEKVFTNWILFPASYFATLPLWNVPAYLHAAGDKRRADALMDRSYLYDHFRQSRDKPKNPAQTDPVRETLDWEKLFVSYEGQSAALSDRYDKATSDQEVMALDVERVQTLIQSPLFRDLVGKAKIDENNVADFADPRKFSRLEQLVTNREYLYAEYNLIAASFSPPASLAKQEKQNPKLAGQVAALTKNPEYRELDELYESKQITRDEFQYSLAQMAYWKYEFFAQRQILGSSPAQKLDAQGKPTGQNLELSDIESEIVGDLRAKAAEKPGQKETTPP